MDVVWLLYWFTRVIAFFASVLCSVTMAPWLNNNSVWFLCLPTLQGFCDIINVRNATQRSGRRAWDANVKTQRLVCPCPFPLACNHATCLRKSAHYQNKASFHCTASNLPPFAKPMLPNVWVNWADTCHISWMYEGNSSKVIWQEENVTSPPPLTPLTHTRTFRSGGVSSSSECLGNLCNQNFSRWSEENEMIPLPRKGELLFSFLFVSPQKPN